MIDDKELDKLLTAYNPPYREERTSCRYSARRWLPWIW